MMAYMYHLAAILNQSRAGIPDGDDFKVVNLLNAAYFWAGAIAVIIIIIAGFMYTTAAGNANQVKRAKDAIIGSVVGLIIVILAFAITNIVIGAV